MANLTAVDVIVLHNNAQSGSPLTVGSIKGGV